jgi:hypothetical protein
LVILNKNLSRDIDPTGFNQNVTSSTSIGDRFITLPSAIEPMLLNYLNIIDSSSNRVFLEIKPLEYLQEYWPDSSLTDQPRYFANFDDTTLYLAPTPDAVYTMELGYQGRINPLSNTNTTNWYTENASDAFYMVVYLKQISLQRTWKTIIYINKSMSKVWLLLIMKLVETEELTISFQVVH